MTNVLYIGSALFEGRWGGHRDGGCSSCHRTRISSGSSGSAWPSLSSRRV